jgi:hypothetical protein
VKKLPVFHSELSVQQASPKSFMSVEKLGLKEKDDNDTRPKKKPTEIQLLFFFFKLEKGAQKNQIEN